MRANNEEQGADTRPVARLVVNLDSEPKLELQMQPGDTLSVKYPISPIPSQSSEQDAPSPREQRQLICKNLGDLTEYGFRYFLQIELGTTWEKVPGADMQAKILELVRQFEYRSQGDYTGEKYDLNWLYDQVDQYRAQLRENMRPK
jgi:hypothetical protein